MPRLTPGYEIGLPIAFFGLVLIWTLVVVLWRRGNKREYGMTSEARVGAVICVVIGAFYTLGIPWAFYPWSIQYHEYVSKSGVVQIIGNRFTDGHLVTDTSGTVIGDFVVQLAGDPARYDCLDTRCALVRPGDRLTMSCVRQFQWTGIPGWSCNYAKDQR